MPTLPRHSPPTFPRALVSLKRLAGGVLLAGCATGFAQTGLAPASPSVPSPAASANDVPGRLRPTPKVTSPSDAQRSLNLNNPQPEGRVTPQLRIPLGKKDDAPILQRRPTDSGTATPTNGVVGEAAAQCDAQRGEQVRAKCRDQLARQGSR